MFFVLGLCGGDLQNEAPQGFCFTSCDTCIISIIYVQQTQVGRATLVLFSSAIALSMPGLDDLVPRCPKA